MTPERREVVARAADRLRACTDSLAAQLECIREASCAGNDHTYSWPCVYAPGTGDRADWIDGDA